MSLWRPGIIGAIAGWLAPTLAALWFVVPEATLAAILPNAFILGLAAPFYYTPGPEDFDFGLSTVVVLAPIAYALLLIALNYWLWQASKRARR